MKFGSQKVERVKAQNAPWEYVVKVEFRALVEMTHTILLSEPLRDRKKQVAPLLKDEFDELAEYKILETNENDGSVEVVCQVKFEKELTEKETFVVEDGGSRSRVGKDEILSLMFGKFENYQRGGTMEVDVVLEILDLEVFERAPVMRLADDLEDGIETVSDARSGGF